MSLRVGPEPPLPAERRRLQLGTCSGPPGAGGLVTRGPWPAVPPAAGPAGPAAGGADSEQRCAEQLIPGSVPWPAVCVAGGAEHPESVRSEADPES
jgi:hypothetical protein